MDIFVFRAILSFNTCEMSTHLAGRDSFYIISHRIAAALRISSL